MFDLGMIESYVSYLRKEGGVSLLSSLDTLSKKDLKRLSLPLLSWAYFLEKDENSKGIELKSLVQRDEIRKMLVTGSDIFRSSGSKIIPEKMKIFDKSINLIKSVWPEYFKVIKIIKPRISKTLSEDLFESASDPKIFGQIVYRMDSESPVKWAEILVHELAHHYLNIVITAHDDQEIFSQPWDETKYSAIRMTERPLIGIYHGTFAEACMVELALRILSKKGMQPECRESALKMLCRFGPIFKKDYQTISDRGILGFDEHIRDIIDAIHSRLEKYESKNSLKEVA